MNAVQKEVCDRVNARFKKTMELYELRNKVAHIVYDLPERDLRELVRLLDTLTPDELKDVAGYAQGLAAFRAPAQESQDAPVQLENRPPSPT